MKEIELTLFWVTVFGYVTVFVLQLFQYMNRNRAVKLYHHRLLQGVFLFHTLVLILHWIETGHPPTTNRFEIDISGAWFLMLTFLVFVKLKRVEKSIGLAVIPFTFLLLGYAYSSGPDFSPMRPAFVSPWIVVHVIFAWIAFSSYAIATGAAIFYILKSRYPDGERMKRLPLLSALDDTGYRYIAFGFINHAIMLIAGSIWAKKLWGRYWSWDPLDTWNLIAFLIYAFILHARSFLKWKDMKGAWLNLIGFIVMIISYWGVSIFVPTAHPGI